MKTIGIRELKSSLSERIREVRSGEVYLVTDRGTVVAELRAPGSGAPASSDEFERRLGDWIHTGLATPGAPNEADLYRPSRLRSKPGTAEQVLDSLRGES